MKYGYESIDSFSRAFKRFHGVTPTSIRRGASFKTFLPLKILFTIQGGDKLNFIIKDKFALKLIGILNEFSIKNEEKEISRIWTSFYKTYGKKSIRNSSSNDEYTRIVIRDGIGSFAINSYDAETSTCKYIIAGRYTGGVVPQNMEVFEFPECKWAIFDSYGPIPETLITIKQRVLNEWLPNNDKYKLATNFFLEWYDYPLDQLERDHRCALLVPIREKDDNNMR